MDLDHLQALLGDRGEAAATEAVESTRDIWVIGETVQGEDRHQLTPLTAQLLGKARELASDLGAYVHAALLGYSLGDLGDELIALGADGAHLADAPELKGLLLEPALHVLATLFEEFSPAVALFPAGPLGDQIAPRLAQRLGGTLTTQCVALQPDLATRAITAAYAVYDGEYYEGRTIVAEAEYGPDTAIQMFSVLPNVFHTPDPDRYRSGTVEPIALDLSSCPARVKVVGRVEYQRPELPISKARRIVALGHDLGDENLAAARELAARLGAEIAGDRTAVAAGWINPEQVVGLMGYDVAPFLYLALGVRGSTEHNVGLEKARFVAAVHTDPAAPIFSAADLGLVAKPGEILVRLEDLL